MSMPSQAIEMLTSSIWAIPLEDKSAESVVAAFLEHIYPYGMPQKKKKKILADNNHEFVNAIFKQVAGS